MIVTLPVSYGKIVLAPPLGVWALVMKEGRLRTTADKLVIPREFAIAREGRKEPLPVRLIHFPPIPLVTSPSLVPLVVVVLEKSPTRSRFPALIPF